MEKQKSTSPGSAILPEEIVYASWKTAIGPVHAAAISKGICCVAFGRVNNFPERIQREYGIHPRRDPPAFLSLRKQLDRYLLGNTSSFAVPLALLGGTAFDRAVWKTIAQIPYGETRSYQWVAQRIGRPLGVRAVGRACGRNPVPILIPCHRVIAKSGQFGGFTGGIQYKKWLLKVEHAAG